MEESAKCYLAARAVGEIKHMTDAQITQAVEVFKYYGQDTAVIPKDLVKRI
jgi:H2-forming N5,N10-methylenetetrahydromethanopterin dehydrogenase-like enzyme